MSQYGQEIEEVLKRRTRQFALSVLAIVNTSDRGLVPDVLMRQLVRSATSVGANYRSACRARSKADMASKLAIAEEELDESLYWLDLLVDSGAFARERVNDLSREGQEILRILVASIRTLREGNGQPLGVRELRVAYLKSTDDDFLLPEADELQTTNPKL